MLRREPPGSRALPCCGRGCQNKTFLGLSKACSVHIRAGMGVPKCGDDGSDVVRNDFHWDGAILPAQMFLRVKYSSSIIHSAIATIRNHPCVPNRCVSAASRARNHRRDSARRWRRRRGGCCGCSLARWLQRRQLAAGAEQDQQHQRSGGDGGRNWLPVSKNQKCFLRAKEVNKKYCKFWLQNLRNRLD